MVESRRRLREGGKALKRFALQPNGTGPYSTKRKEGDRSGYASKGGAPCRKRTGEYTRRTVDDDQSKTGGEEAGKTQGEDIRHTQDDESQRVTCSSTKEKREHVTEVFPLSSLIGHTPKTGLQPNSVASVSRVCLIVKSHQEDEMILFLATT